MRVLALDFGAARTGVAVSDATGTLARPVCVVERAASDAGLDRVVALVAEHGAEVVVVGLPLTLRGERGEQARATEAFVETLRERLDVPVETGGRALHDGAGAADGWPCARGRARRRAPPAGVAGAGAMRRGLALLLAVAVVAAGAFAVTAWIAGGRRHAGRDGDDTAAARAPPDHLPRGVHDRARWPIASRPCGRSRSRSVE